MPTAGAAWAECEAGQGRDAPSEINAPRVSGLRWPIFIYVRGVRC